MLTFILSLRDGEIVDSADSPGKLDFSKVAGQIKYEVSARFEDSPRAGGPAYLVATVDLTEHEAQAGWVACQLCEEIDFRRAFPSFEDEVRNTDGPLVAFGDPNKRG